MWQSMKTQTSTGSCLFALSTRVAYASLTWQPMSSLWYVYWLNTQNAFLQLNYFKIFFTSKEIEVTHFTRSVDYLAFTVKTSIPFLIFTLKFTSCVLCGHSLWNSWVTLMRRPQPMCWSLCVRRFRGLTTLDLSSLRRCWRFSTPSRLSSKRCFLTAFLEVR